MSSSKSSWFRHQLLLALPVLLLSCLQLPPRIAARSPASPEIPLLESDSSKLLDEILDPGNFKDDCDEQQEVSYRKLAKILKSHREEMESYLMSISDEAHSRSELNEGERLVKPLPLGKDFFLIQTSMNRPLSRELQTQSSESVEVLLDRAQHEDLQIEDWLQIDSDFKALLLSDSNRRISLQDYYSNPHSEGDYKKVRELLIQCLSQGDCRKESFLNSLENEKLRSFIEDNPIFNYQLSTLSEKTSLEHILKTLSTNLEWRKIRSVGAVKHIQRRSKDIFQVFLEELGDKDIEKTLSQEIESYWKEDRFGVEIVWVDSNHSPKPYKVNLSQEIGRAYVDWEQQSLNLFKGDTLHVLLHEFGHVLGLPDRYYEIRDLEKCSYKMEYFEEDIMSSNLPGSRPLKKDWQDLAALYPIQK